MKCHLHKLRCKSHKTRHASHASSTAALRSHVPRILISHDQRKKALEIHLHLEGGLRSLLNHGFLARTRRNVPGSGLLVEELASLAHGHADERVLAVSSLGVATLAAGEHLQRLHGRCGSHGTSACWSTATAATTEELLVGLHGIWKELVTVGRILGGIAYVARRSPGFQYFGGSG